MKKLLLFCSAALTACMLTATVYASNTVFGTNEWVQIPPSTPAEPTVTTTRLDENNIKVTFDFPGYYMRTAKVGSDIYTDVSIPGCTNGVETGKPSLPTYYTRIEIPKKTTPKVTVLNADIEKLKGQYNIYPKQAPDLDSGTSVFEKNAATYESTSFFPESHIYRTEVNNMILDNKTYLGIRISPFRVIPNTQYAEFCKSLVISINCEASVTPAPTSTPTPKANLVFGDVNDDKVVDQSDYLLLRRYLLDVITELPAPRWKTTADLNCDGEIDSIDYYIMNRYLLQIIKTLPL